ncbi:HCL032Wp [Eremothecium sinecaudum]|uniref:HCL032Wp n=1 Tax=Eremothecium sinecaudum TaxID=45286 RepID=A0A0X8HRI4_9SACH|nr:HCL032Wp [Eremothecium sinecaudum]AMD20119.1 HCL032Wp [Eremothecium sinecaudum]
MSDFVRTAYSRVGREKQLYSPETGARMVAGSVALNSDKTKVIMVQSSVSKRNWVLPKGGIEVDEPDFEHTARRETWEEAGVVGDIVKYLGVIKDSRPNSGTHKPSEFHFYEMNVTELAPEYPEKEKRARGWFSYEAAYRELELANRPELIEALKRSGIVKCS